MTRSLVALFISIIALLSACGDNTSARLIHDDTVPEDLEQLADEAWADFLDAIPGRFSCVEPVTLHAAWELENRGEYRPDTATIVVRVPGTPATLRSELIHEFAHHLEFACDDHSGLRDGFLTAQGFAASAEWFTGESWETTPSEQYAEAMVEMIEGTRSHRGGINITSAALAVLEAWANGGL